MLGFVFMSFQRHDIKLYNITILYIYKELRIEIKEHSQLEQT